MLTSGFPLPFMDDAPWDASSWQMGRFNLLPQQFDTNLDEINKNRSWDGLCQVDGCQVDVATMRDYHARYKVCPVHLKASQVLMQGNLNRFCQQCGRFHPLREFDGSKRSCRDRLEKHNARRRRSREMKHMLKNHGYIDEALLAAKYGMAEEDVKPQAQRLLHRGDRQVKRKNSSSRVTSLASDRSGSSGGNSPTEANSLAATIAAAGAALGASYSTLVPLSQNALPGSYNSNATAVETAARPSLNMLDDGLLAEMFHHNQTKTSNPDVDLAAAAAAAMNQVGNLLSFDAASVMDLDDVAALHEISRDLGLATSNEAAAKSANATGSKTGPTPSASRAPFRMFSGVPVASTQNSVPLSRVAQLQALSDAQLATFAINGQVPPFLETGAAARAVLSGATLPDLVQEVRHHLAQLLSAGSASAISSDSPPPPALDDALKWLSQGVDAEYASEEQLYRFSTKIFERTPDQLPSSLRTTLLEMLKSGSLEGYMRPGCVHVTVSGLMSAEAARALESKGLRSAVAQLAGSCPEVFDTDSLVFVQFANSLALARNGRVLQELSTATAKKLFPEVVSIEPAALVPSSRDEDVKGVTVCVYGTNMGHKNDVVLARSQGKYADVEIVDLVEVEGDEEEEDTVQCLTISIGKVSPGPIEIEIMRGGYLCPAKTVLITKNSQLAEEICSSRRSPLAGNALDDTLVYEMGRIEEKIDEHAPIEEKEAIARSARRVLVFALRRRWLEACRTALEALTCGMDSVEDAIVAADREAIKLTGLSVYALAVGSGDVTLVEAVIDWNRNLEDASIGFSPCTAGMRGLTALHFAAIVDKDFLAVAGRIMESSGADVLSGWGQLCTDDGKTPLDFAHAVGAGALLETLLAEEKFRRATSALTDPIKPRLSSSVEDFVVSPTDSVEEEDDDIYRLQTPMLTFQNRALEARYLKYFTAAQTQVDVVFGLILIASQVSWILRWNLSSGAGGITMAALLLFNTVNLCVAFFSPRRYALVREPLCIISHVAHKVAQAVVSVAPVVGTVYSSHYTPLIALVEGSSFASIVMLSFGANLRFPVHVLVNVFHFVVATLIDRHICIAAFTGMSENVCIRLMIIFQSVFCFALPCALVYLRERQSRRLFLEFLK